MRIITALLVIIVLELAALIYIFAPTYRGEMTVTSPGTQTRSDANTGATSGGGPTGGVGETQGGPTGLPKN